MRSSTQRAVEPAAGHADAAPALSGPAVAALMLPQVGADATTDQLLADAHRAKLAALAVDLLDMQMLPRALCETDLAGAVVQGIGNWLDTMLDGLVWHKLAASIHHSLFDAMGVSPEMLEAEGQRYAGQRSLDELYEQACGMAPQTPHFVVALAPTAWRMVQIREGVERLEAAVPGLGWAAVQAFTSAAVPFGAKEFTWVEFAIQYSQWGGHETCAAYLEESGESLEDFGGISDAQFESFAPLQRMRAAPKLTQSRLQQVAASGQERAATVARLLIDMHALRRAPLPCNAACLQGECSLQPPMDPTVFVIWSNEDPVCRIADDFYEIMASGEDYFTEATAYIAVPLDRPGGLQRTTKRWQRFLDRLRMADQLLTLLTLEGEQT